MALSSAVFDRRIETLLGRGDDRICIAVLDGPVDQSHACFRGAKLRQLATLVQQESSDGHASAHGTHVASVIFGQPGSTVSGIAPDCRGLIIPIFADDTLTCGQLDLARAILLAIENGAHVINISGGQLTPSGEPEPILAQAIESCARHNILVVAAAGNDGCECLHVPAAAPSVLAVGAMDREGRPLATSNWGVNYRTQGILAPGVNVIGAVPGGGITSKSGTSFATPLVSGLVGLLGSLQIKLGKTPDPHAIRAALLKSATPCLPSASDGCLRFLSGSLNVPAVIKYVTRGYEQMTDEQISLSESSISESNQGALGAALEPSNARLQHVAASRTIANDGVRMSDNATPAPAVAPSAAPIPEAIAEVKISSTGVIGAAGRLKPSDCGCGGGANCTCGATAVQKPALIYALGKLGYDFGSEARRDSFIQSMPADHNNPLIPDQLLSYLNSQPSDAASVIWTLNLDATPIYAVQPAGPFAATGYERLREFLRGQSHEGVELISIPGVIAGSVRLQSGQVVPVVVPAIRGMYSWATKPLVQHVLGARPRAAEAQATYDAQSSGLADFLARVYYDMRNLGVTAEQRAMNYSATNALQITEVIRSTTQQELDLDTVTVKKSPICRPDSDCYDVELSFFNPSNTNVANRIFRFTVDVSDVIPVTVGSVRSWTRRP